MKRCPMSQSIPIVELYLHEDGSISTIQYTCLYKIYSNRTGGLSSSKWNIRTATFSVNGLLKAHHYFTGKSIHTLNHIYSVKQIHIYIWEFLRFVYQNQSRQQNQNTLISNASTLLHCGLCKLKVMSVCEFTN